MTARPMHLDGKSIADAINGAVNSAGSVSSNVTGSFDFGPEDVGSTVVSDDAAASTATIPAGLPIGRIRVVNIGAGKVTIAAGSGVTLAHVGAGVVMDTSTVAELLATAQDAWLVIGAEVS